MTDQQSVTNDQPTHQRSRMWWLAIPIGFVGFIIVLNWLAAVAELMDDPEMAEILSRPTGPAREIDPRSL